MIRENEIGIKEICSYSECTGCGACKFSCPKAAITMRENKEGFLYPYIDREKCISCGICKLICPSNKEKIVRKFKPKVYALMGNDDIRKQSSSGGAFTLVAEYILKNGGYVCGAIFDNQKQKIVHIITNNIEDLKKIRKSKYVQSDLGNCFPAIRSLLEEKTSVLFSGTPCQIAGLKSYLKKNYDNLYLIDILCHSVPSPKVLEKFIESIDLDNDENIIDINFRSKENGWKPIYETKIVTNKRIIEIPPEENIYNKAFFNGLSSRECCGTCKYANITRLGDLTLGDFWWIEKYKKQYNDGLGTSLVIQNTKKGEFLLKQIKKECKLFKKVPFSKVTNLNLKRPSNLHNNRKTFYDNLDKISLKENIENCLNDKFDVAIINMWWAVSNYGALLTGYAIQQVLKQLGYSSKLINNISMCPDQEKVYKNTFNNKFREEYLDCTEIMRTSSDFELLNNRAPIFITGSDQVFAPKWMNKHIDYYLLNFVGAEKKKIAFSASFGVNETEFLNLYDKKTIELMKLSLKTFDFLSTREKSGLNIMNNIMEVQSKWIIDPVFILQKEYFENIANKNQTDYSNKIVSYVLDSNNDYEKLYDRLSEKYGIEVVRLYNTNCNVEEFLGAIKNCKYFITDSFHGVCFAIIFNKLFSAVVNENRGKTRFDSLNFLFNISNNIYPDVKTLMNSDLVFYENDYLAINKIIDEKRKDALTVLNEILKERKEPDYTQMINNYNLMKYKYSLLKESTSTKFIINKILKMIYNIMPSFIKKIILLVFKRWIVNNV